MSTEPARPEQSSDVPTSEATTDYDPSALARTGLTPASRAPATGQPAGEETSPYDPRASVNLPGTLAETRPQSPDEPPDVGETDFTVAEATQPVRYFLKRYHARGGMGEIWLAEDQEIGREVALKRMRKGREGHKDKFLFEAQITGRLEHPGVVPVHELGCDAQGRPFYIMKFVRGRTLKDAIKEYHDTPSTSETPREVKQLRLLGVFVNLCQTIAFAHSRNVLHRDIKPDNVMLGEYGETLVLDWGIAKMLGHPDTSGGALSADVSTSGGESRETQAGTVKGTPSYFAPEMAEGLVSEVDQRSDVYLLGATLYQILTGQRPRKGANLPEVIELAATEPPVPPRKLNPAIPRALEAICQKAMAFKKQDRYPSATLLAEDVQRYLAGEPVSAYPEPFLARAWRWARKHRRALGRAAALVMLGTGALVATAQVLEYRQVARRLQEEHQAREDIKEFRRLADETRFYLASHNPIDEHAPYYDIAKGQKSAQAAVAITDQWGRNVENLPLAKERAAVKHELYDLLLLLAAAETFQATTAKEAESANALLDRAAALGLNSRGYQRLRAACFRLTGKPEEAARAAALAEGPQGETTALDHFLLGEKYRTEAVSQQNAPARVTGWQPNRELIGKALAEYRQAIEMNADHYWSHFQLGRMYQAMAQFAEAAEALKVCIALKPDSPWGYSARALALSRLKRYPEAEAELNNVLRQNPEDRPARLARAVVYWHEEKGKEAFADFAEVLKPPAEKRLLEAAYYRAILHLQRGQTNSALEDLDRIAAEKPDFYRAYHLRALVNLVIGRDAQALDDLNSYLSQGKSLDERSALAHEQRGRLLRLLIPDLKPHIDKEKRASLIRSKCGLAVAELQQAVKLGCKSSRLFDDFGAVLEMAGRPLEAIDAYTQGLEIAPNDVKLLVKRGWALVGLNQYEKARDDFAKVINDHPDHAEAHTGLGYVHACRNRSADAQREANLALLHGAGDYLVLHNTACIYAELSEADSKRLQEYQDLALDELGRAIELWSREPATLDEQELVKEEPAFRQPLRERPEFQRLLRPVKK
jgi:Flp pilus assembly protein TadD